RAKADEVRSRRPELGLPQLTEDEIDRRAIMKARQARSDLAAMAMREKTAGGSLGIFAGSAASGFTDPVNLLAFPLAAPTGLGILQTALAWSLIAGGTQTAIELAGLPFRERVEPGYGESAEPAGNILGAGAFGGGLG